MLYQQEKIHLAEHGQFHWIILANFDFCFYFMKIFLKILKQPEYKLTSFSISELATLDCNLSFPPVRYCVLTAIVIQNIYYLVLTEPKTIIIAKHSIC